MYKITKALTPEHGSSNNMFFNPNTILGKYVKIDTLDKVFYFVPRYDDCVPDGYVMVNSKQRIIMKKTDGDLVRIEFIDKVFNAAEKIFIDIVRSEQDVVDCVNLEKIIRHYLAEQPFTSGQDLSSEINKSLVTYRFSKLTKNGNDIETGILSGTTELIFVSSNKKIRLINIENQTLFKKNLNLQGLGIGGLGREFNTIMRRAFASRIIPSDMRKSMGIKNIKGMILYGPPGCGKTLLARKIGEMLDCVEPKIVKGPELFDKFVGGSEENVRKLFEPALNDKSGKLHVIICDEFDALCKHRGTSTGGTGVNDNVVNQLLTMIDGPKEIDNVLLICLTNRFDLIDDAMLRPGRLELHIEIKLPTEEGRLEILSIHTNTMKQNNHLSSDVDLKKIANITRNYTGAELEGLIKCASQSALFRLLDISDGNVKTSDEKPIVSMSDLMFAYSEISPLFGKISDEIEKILSTPFILWSDELIEFENKIKNTFDSLKLGNMSSILLTGDTYIGKTKFVAHVACSTGIQCVRIITPEHLLKVHDKCSYINKIFNQCIKAESSILIIDGFERLIGWSSVGLRYDNTIVQTIMVLLRSIIETSTKILVLCTGNNKIIMKDLDIFDLFDEHFDYPDMINLRQMEKYFPSYPSLHLTVDGENVKISNVFKTIKHT